MAEIHYIYEDNKHPLTSYEAVIDTCNWLETGLRNGCKGKDIRHCDYIISFSSGSVSYRCDSLDEFKKYAFGKTFEFESLYISVSEVYRTKTVSVFARLETDKPQRFSIKADDEVSISNVVAALKSGAPMSYEEKITIQYEDKSIHIGDGNTITGSIVGQNNTVENNSAPKESLFSKAFWNIAIPIACGVLVTALCLWFDLSK